MIKHTKNLKDAPCLPRSPKNLVLPTKPVFPGQSCLGKKSCLSRKIILSCQKSCLSRGKIFSCHTSRHPVFHLQPTNNNPLRGIVDREKLSEVIVKVRLLQYYLMLKDLASWTFKLGAACRTCRGRGWCSWCWSLPQSLWWWKFIPCWLNGDFTISLVMEVQIEW